MQYGLLICKNTDNIGDDIQTFAQKRFLPKIDYFIDRESLDTFFPTSNQEESVAVIMNAWYMYHKYNWPPSPYIYPLLISMHITKKDYFGIGTKFLEGMGGEYLKKNGPVGARDVSTLNLLKEKDIDAYLSGCLTLTIKLDSLPQKNEIVYLVDLDKRTENLIKAKFPEENYKIVKHAVRYYDEEISYEQRLDTVEELLKEYQNAKCVITSRLHCALPCLALETSVLLIYEKHFEDRIKTFLDLLYYSTIESIENDKWNYDISNPPNNKNEYLNLRNCVEERCKEFIVSCEAMCIKNDVSEIEIFKKYWFEKAIWQKNLLTKAEISFRDNLNKQQEWIKQLMFDKKWAEEQVTNYDLKNIELRNYIDELIQGKEWLEQQNKNQLEEVQNQKKYIEELMQGKEWLEQQNKNQLEEIQNQKKYTEELIQGKEWLEQQNTSQLEEIQNQKNYIGELMQGKQWLEQQNHLISQSEIQLKNEILDLEKQLAASENDIAKLRYKLNLLMEDRLIQKVIKIKKYQV